MPSRPVVGATDVVRSTEGTASPSLPPQGGAPFLFHAELTRREGGDGLVLGLGVLGLVWALRSVKRRRRGKR